MESIKFVVLMNGKATKPMSRVKAKSLENYLKRIFPDLTIEMEKEK